MMDRAPAPTAREETRNDQARALEILKLMADDTRWRLINELRLSDRQVGELVTRLNLPQNLVSYHLGILRQAGLVQVHRSDADARANYYGIDYSALRAGYRQVGSGLQIEPERPAPALPALMVVFLCTGNSARSQIAEGWMRHLSGGRVAVRSAGVRPQSVHPMAVQVMAEAGVDIGYQQSKDIDTLAGTTPDVVVTVCDLAREACADCISAKTRLHWSVADPARVRGEQQLNAFRMARDDLRLRIEGLLGLLPALAQA